MRANTRLILAALTALLIASAGCADVISADGPTTFDADEVSVSEDAANEAGYDLDSSEPVIINRSVEFQDEERRIEITNHAAVYTKSIEESTVGFFVVFSSPEAKMAGQVLNPLYSMDEEELVERVASEYVEVSEIESTGSTEVEVLDEDRTVEEFSAVADVSGEEADVNIHVTRFSHDDDVIVAIGGYPNGYPGEENVTTMTQGIQHAGE